MISSPQQPIVQAQHVMKQVASGDAPLTILRDINLTVGAGETLAILGVSGSGKSTLLALLAGLDTPTQGRLFLAGQEITRLSEDGKAKVRLQNVGFVFQSFQLLPSLTALENILLPIELIGVPNAKQQAINLLERVGLSARSQHYPNQLSGGEQQRVAIARAFASNPKVLFADEPTGNLDQQTSQRICDLLFQLNSEQQTTLILVTHDAKLAQRCQHQVVLVDGELQKHANL
jgi:putative ABC transport system ATP-binding protein